MESVERKNIKVNIRTGDFVKILSGRNRNRQGKILKVLPKKCRAIVEGMNIISRHLKSSSKNPKGVVEKKEAPIHISNLMLVDPVSGQATRVGKKCNGEGKLQRYSKKTGNFI